MGTNGQEQGRFRDEGYEARRDGTRQDKTGRDRIRGKRTRPGQTRRASGVAWLGGDAVLVPGTSVRLGIVVCGRRVVLSGLDGCQCQCQCQWRCRCGQTAPLSALQKRGTAGVWMASNGATGGGGRRAASGGRPDERRFGLCGQRAYGTRGAMHLAGRLRRTSMAAAVFSPGPWADWRPLAA